MKTKKMLTIGAISLAMAFSTAMFAAAQTQLDSVNIKTDGRANKVVATDGGKVYLSSVDVYGGSKINGGSLEVDSRSVAGDVTATGQGAEVSLASLLIHDGSEVGSINGPVKMDVKVGDITATEGRINAGSIHLNNSKITGALTVTNEIKVTAGKLEVGEGAELGLASLLMDGSEAENITIGKMEANLQDVTVENGGRAYFSTLKMNNAKAGSINFSGFSKVNSKVSVSEDATLNMASVVLDGSEIGDATFDLHAEVDSVEITGGGIAMIGGVNIQ